MTMQASDAVERLWLWRNFVDGRPEYWAFDNPFPIEGGGDPLTRGEPCGWALFKKSTNGRPSVPDSEVEAAIAAMPETAALLAAIEAREWQPIETAPHACHSLMTYFDADCGEWMMSVAMFPTAGPWTHWMPLPKPPALTAPAQAKEPKL